MGAGGNNGGISRFLIGLIMLVAGLYLLLSSIIVNFDMGHRIHYGEYSMTTGYVFVPFMFGIGLLFFNAKSPWGWVLTIGSLVILIFGIITSTSLRLQRMDAFSLIVILVLLVGGLGLFLSSFRNYS